MKTLTETMLVAGEGMGHAVARGGRHLGRTPPPSPLCRLEQVRPPIHRAGTPTNRQSRYAHQNVGISWIPITSRNPGCSSSEFGRSPLYGLRKHFSNGKSGHAGANTSTFESCDRLRGQQSSQTPLSHMRLCADWAFALTSCALCGRAVH